ncbi:SixA phosphatase family protein [Winogradskyella wichelsiae]|uniref:SixA phosphatase family protein n=1 Tax=Winogradskyella wichelsiae TaxID=2697007 RepID=UPI0015CDCD1E|nr:histidine phosphatase family protein [Winogradskyella wichelsiae]
MKEIVLVRHGKSSWKYDVIDSERPLKQRGIDDSLLVISELCARGAVPSTIFSSPANRALSTCKIFMNFIEIPQNQIIVDENLYDFEGRNVIDFIKRLPNSIDDVMIFGHNHAFTSISNIFGNTYIDNLPTSGLVKLRFDIDDWKDLKKGITEFIITPKDLKA